LSITDANVLIGEDRNNRMPSHKHNAMVKLQGEMEDPKQVVVVAAVMNIGYHFSIRYKINI